MKNLSRGKLIFFLLSVCFILIYYFGWPDAPYKDVESKPYMDTSLDLQAGLYTRPHGRTYSYPAFLWLATLMGNGWRSLYLLQLVLYALSVNMVRVMLKMAGVARKLRLAFFLTAWLPIFVLPAFYLRTEGLCGFYLISGLFLLTSSLSGKRRYLLLAGSGLTFALAAYTRPTYQMIVPLLTVFLLACFWRRDRFITRGWRSTVFLAPFVLLFGFVIQYNKRTFGYAAITPYLGYNLCTKTYSYLEDIPEGKYSAVKKVLIHHHRQQMQVDSIHAAKMYIWAALGDIEKVTGKYYEHYSDEMLELNKELILANPMKYLYEVVICISEYFFITFPPETGNSKLTQGLTVLLYLGFMGLFFMASVWFFYRWSWQMLFALYERRIPSLRPRSFLFPAMYLIFFYTLVISCMADIGVPRYRLPTDLMMLAIGFGALQQAGRKFREKVHARQVLTEVKPQPQEVLY